MATRILELRQGILKKNDLYAADLRARFSRDDIFVVNLVSSPGTGKTALLEKTLERLVARGHSCGALVADLETDNDAKRLARSGAPVRQINTHGRCHVEAEWIGQHLDAWTLEPAAGVDPAEI
ncbi:MAG: GTP-binding protein, partial [Acidobacteriota bacterium]